MKGGLGFAGVGGTRIGRGGVTVPIGSGNPGTDVPVGFAASTALKSTSDPAFRAGDADTVVAMMVRAHWTLVIFETILREILRQFACYLRYFNVLSMEVLAIMWS